MYHDIANSLGGSHSTICRKVHRFSTRFEYSPTKAHQLAAKATLKKGRKSLMETRPELLSDLFQKLLEDYSPEQISKKFKIESADEPLKENSKN